MSDNNTTVGVNRSNVRLITATLCRLYQLALHGDDEHKVLASAISSEVLLLREMCAAEDSFLVWSDIVYSHSDLVRLRPGKKVALTEEGVRFVQENCPQAVRTQLTSLEELVDALEQPPTTSSSAAAAAATTAKSSMTTTSSASSSSTASTTTTTRTSTTSSSPPPPIITTTKFAITDIFLLRLYRRARVTRNSFFALPLACVREEFNKHVCAMSPKTITTSSPALLTFDGILEACKHCVTVNMQEPASIRLTEFGVSTVERSVASFSPTTAAAVQQLQATMPPIDDYAPADFIPIKLAEASLAEAIV